MPKTKKKTARGITIETNSLDTEKSIVRAMNEIIRDTGLLGDVKDLIEKRIRTDRTNLATGRKLKDIGRDWSDQREYLKGFNPTHPKYGKGTSNLTFTGAFIDSIKGEIFTRKSLIVFKPTGKHPGYKGPSGRSTRRTQPDNLRIAEGQKAMGRNVLQITKKLRGEILKLLTDRLEKIFD